MSKTRPVPRVALYWRVHEDEGAAARELEELRARCRKEGWQVVEEYLDYDTPTSVTRDDFKRLLDDAAHGAFEIVLFTDLGSFIPEGVRDTVRYLGELDRLGVAYVSSTEEQLSTLGAGAGFVRSTIRLLEAQETRRISVRVRSGMTKAKQAGRHVGRPRVFKETRRKIVKLRSEGKSLAETAAAVGVSESTVVKYQRRPVDDLLEALLPVER